MPDIDAFRKEIARKRNVLAALLSHARQMFDARLVGLVFGTDDSGERFLPPLQWDRGVIDRFDGPGAEGAVMRWIGPLVMKLAGLSPIPLSERNELGELHPANGITAYALRNHQDFYDSGIRILLAEKRPSKASGTDPEKMGYDLVLQESEAFTISAYDGSSFTELTHVKADTRITKRFRAKNFMAAYVPDYGAIVFNTVHARAFVHGDGRFRRTPLLNAALDHLVLAIESASLAYLGRARGRAAARLITRKESRLRQTAIRLAEKQALVREREAHLMAVGGVSSRQLKMAPTAVHDGVFAFLDMAESVRVSRQLGPRANFFVLNLCHEIAAENARKFGCRVDNIIGDAVFFENLSIFDSEAAPSTEARLMRMICLLASVLGGIHALASGDHSLDREQRCADLLRSARVTLGFRVGMSLGSALVGPLGSQSRRIITALGESVQQASRLESSGRINHIHITADTAGILKDAWISKDTPMIYGFAEKVLTDRGETMSPSGLSFFEFYRRWRGLDRGFIKTRKNPVCYKEFSALNTSLIPCLPEKMLPDVCPGI